MTRILLIEDDQRLRTEIAKALNLEGFKVVEADNGEVAIGFAHQTLPDLIICDITIPGMDGHEVLHYVRSTPELAKVPFILITGDADRASMRRSMELGADDYIPKPFTRSELLAAIKARLKRSAKVDTNLDEAKRHLTRMVTHELRTPLTLVKMAQDIIDRQMDTLSPQAMREYLDLLRSGNQRLSHVVDQIVYTTSLETDMLSGNSIEQEGRPAPLGELLLASINLARQLDYRHRNITIYTDIRDPQVLVQSDVPALRHAIMELVLNAVNFSSDGTVVTLSQWASDASVWVSILDQGSGMADADIQRAMRPFEQINRETSDQQGMGLGLPLARRIVEAHGGTLELNTVINKGTQVTVELPIYASDSAEIFPPN